MLALLLLLLLVATPAWATWVPNCDQAPNHACMSQAETITADWVNTAYPWADNEVSDTLTCSNATGVTCTDCITLGTETSGSYVDGVTAGGGLTMTGTEGADVGMTVGATENDIKVWRSSAWVNRTLSSDFVVSDAPNNDVTLASAISHFSTSVDDTEMTAEDFGDFTCSGLEDGCTLTMSDFTTAQHDHGDTDDAGPVALGATSTATTASAEDNDTSIATTAFVQQETTGLALFSHTTTALAATDMCLGSVISCSGCAASTSVFNCQLIVPHTCTLRNLFAETDTAVTAGSYAVTVRYMASESETVNTTTITCTIDSTAGRACSDTTHTQDVTAGQKIDVFWDASADQTPAVKKSWSIVCD